MNFPRRGWLNRLRHGRGFGVHSPSAYRYIREVLHQPCAYYAYDAVDGMASVWPGGKPHARMLLRIAVHAGPRRVAVGTHPELSSVAARICRLACPGVVAEPEPGPETDMIVLLPGAGCGDTVFRRAAAGATIVIPDRHRPEASALLARIRAELPFGHCFCNGGGTVVFVGNRNVPAQSFDVRF